MSGFLSTDLLRAIAQYTLLGLLLLYASINLSYAKNPQLNQPDNAKGVVGYYPSWGTQNLSDGAKTDLAQLPSVYTVINLSFMRPNTSYKAGQTTFAGTGLAFAYSPAVLKQAIAKLRERNPQTKILVSIGGGDATTGWDALNVKAIKAFVDDFNLDGVDIDFEASPRSINCVFPATGGGNCSSDRSYINTINALRAALPREHGYMISLAGFSTGAFGEKGLQWEHANPLGSPYRGMTINILQEAGDALDMVYVMAYDADEGRSGFSATQAFDAYQHYFKGPLYLGIEIPPEGWGKHVLTGQRAAELARYVSSHGGAGMMLWSIPKRNKVASGVDAQCLTTIICSELDRDDCLDLKSACPPSEIA